MRRRSKLHALALLGFLALVASLPFLTDDRYLLRIATVTTVYWVLIAGLNLLVGYAGVLSIGHVGLLAIGAYTFAILAGPYGIDPFLGLLAAAGTCTAVGLVVGLPSLRLPGFYFALSTVAFGLIVVELALAFPGVTGGTVGLAARRFPAPFDTAAGEYWLALAVACCVTWMTWNVARLMWGRSLVAIRDSDVAARSVAIRPYALKIVVFAFSGATAGLAGGLFARTQSYITPEAFNFDFGLYFFIAIIIGGRGSIVGPFVGAVLLALLPDLFGSLQRYTAFFYGAVLLVVVLLQPEGFGVLFERLLGRFDHGTRGGGPIRPDPEALEAAIKAMPR